MPYLKKIDTGAVTDYLDTDSPEYQILTKMRFTANTTISGSGGFGAGSGGSYTARTGEPIWESIPIQDINALTASSGGPAKRVLAIWCPGAAKASEETSGALHNPIVGGKITEFFYVPLGEMAESASNYRTITLNQVVITGTPARKLEALANVTFKTNSNSGLLVPTKGTVTHEEFIVENSLQVVSANGGGEQADPGGVVYAVYTKV